MGGETDSPVRSLRLWTSQAPIGGRSEGEGEDWSERRCNYVSEDRSRARRARLDARSGRLAVPSERAYFDLRAHLVFLSIFLCLCFRIFLRRFLITEPKKVSPESHDLVGDARRQQAA